jgi:alpha-D-ribose 1-methylphosphonate 5-triphosphate synthase subunit PhnH
VTDVLPVRTPLAVSFDTGSGSDVSTTRAFRQQRVFRTVLGAFAEPGVVQSIGSESFKTDFESSKTVDTSSYPDVVFSSTSALQILDALLDGDVTLWCSDTVHPHVPTWLRFHTGVGIHHQSPSVADFVLLSHPSELSLVPQFCTGSADEPEAGATVVVVAQDLLSGVPATLTGPGIESTRVCAPAGFTSEIWAVLQHQRVSFPRGVDVLVCCGNAVVGLPRSTRIALER